uniref:Vacuolar protein sorting-associated protein 41 homolog n=1 Tax=Tanacetum cinerariifolium TaxID=118510 RepID=A0A699IKQ0_TANCI|nr:vacuolar protein sorting-associated protein 41 homolog [Tanacetum cinerariifolium]
MTTKRFDVAALPLPESTVIAGLMTMAVPAHMAKKRHALAKVTNQRPQNGLNLLIPGEKDKDKELSSSVSSRDAEDHINWFLQHGWHEKALAAVEAGQGRSELLDES